MSANVSILGNLGRAPETRFTPDGTFVANFSIASNSVRNSPQGKIEETDWFRVTAFGNQARTLAKYAKKGNRLLVQGKLTTGAWLNRDRKCVRGAEAGCAIVDDAQGHGVGGARQRITRRPGDQTLRADR